MADPSVLDITQLSPVRAYGTFANPPSTAFTASQITIKAVDIIRDTLIEGGWSQTGSVQATATLTSPLGWGYISFEAWICTIEGVAFFFYDPTISAPPSGFFNGAVIWPVPVTGDPEANLAAAITSQGVFTATIRDKNTILLTANALGTLGDGILIDANPNIAIGSISQGGGWILQSVPQVDNDFFGNTAFIQMTVTTGAPGSGNLVLSIVIDGFVRDYYPGVSDNWAIIATPYQAMFFTPEVDLFELEDHNNFCWLCTPIIPQTLPSLAYAAFITQPNDLPAVSSLGAGPGMYADMWVAGDLTNLKQVGQSSWSIIYDHSEGAAVADPLGNAVLQPAPLALYAPSVTPPESRIVGFAPDCFVSTFPANLWDQIYQAALYWRCVARQDEPPGAMWMASGETMGSAGPPPDMHTYATGICNVFGPTVTWVSGDQFTAAMVGLTIVINGNFTATISDYFSATGIGISPPYPDIHGLSNVSFSIQLS